MNSPTLYIAFCSIWSESALFANYLLAVSRLQSGLPLSGVRHILRPEIATGRPNWTSKTYRRLPIYLLSVWNWYPRRPKLSKSPPTFNELYDVSPAYLSEIRYLCSLSLKNVPLSNCGSFTDSRVTCRAPVWDICVITAWICQACWVD